MSWHDHAAFHFFTLGPRPGSSIFFRAIINSSGVEHAKRQLQHQCAECAWRRRNEEHACMCESRVTYILRT